MLSHKKTLLIAEKYKRNKFPLLRSLFSLSGSFLLIDFFRKQTPEIHLLQLVPSFYFAFILSTFALLLFFSIFFFKTPLSLEKKLFLNYKLSKNFAFALLTKQSYFLLALSFFLGIFLVPLSLDSFSFLSTKTLENIWSFDEVITLENISIFFLAFLSQFTICCSFILSTEQSTNAFFQNWKGFCLLIFFTAGFLTPTIDCSAQLSLVVAIFFASLTVLLRVKKRLLTFF